MRLRSRSAVVAVALAALPLLAAPSPSPAQRRPEPKESRGIFAALSASNLTCSRYATGTCKLIFRVSDVNSHWGAAKVRGTTNGENTVKPETMSLRRARGKGDWRIVDTGDGGGCSVPKRPRIDLGLVCLTFGPN